MRHYLINKETAGLYVLTDLKSSNCQSLLSCSALYKILYNPGKEVKIFLDDKTSNFQTGEILFCKPLNTVEILDTNHKVKILAFNKDFYPFHSSEDETNFYWFWFFGAKHPETVLLDESEQVFMDTLFKLTEEKFNLKNFKDVDSHKLILKRIITAASLRIQDESNRMVLSELQLETIRKFNTLIENHFKDKNQLSDYMKFLHEPPSRLTTLVKQFLFRPISAAGKSRFFLEVKRILKATTKKVPRTVTEVDHLEHYYATSFPEVRPGTGKSLLARNLSSAMGIYPGYD